jgi:hypothetical protein
MSLDVETSRSQISIARDMCEQTINCECLWASTQKNMYFLTLFSLKLFNWKSCLRWTEKAGFLQLSPIYTFNKAVWFCSLVQVHISILAGNNFIQNLYTLKCLLKYVKMCHKKVQNMQLKLQCFNWLTKSVPLNNLNMKFQQSAKFEPFCWTCKWTFIC